MLKLLQSIFLSIFLLTSFSSTLDAGIIKKTAKVGAVYGASKVASNVLKKNKDKIFTKKQVNDRAVYQQKVDPNKVIERTNPRTGETIKETNLDRMKNGKPPYIEKNGKLEPIELHHSRQNDKGSLFELSKSTHKITDKDKGAKALHPYSNKKNPDNPVPKDRSDGFDKERTQYWKDRANSLEKGVSP